MATWEPDEIDFEDQYDKADPIDDADLDASMTLLNESKRVQEELKEKLSTSEWTSMNKGERTKLEQQIVKDFQALYYITYKKWLHGNQMK